MQCLEFLWAAEEFVRESGVVSHAKSFADMTRSKAIAM